MYRASVRVSELILVKYDIVYRATIIRNGSVYLLYSVYNALMSPAVNIYCVTKSLFVTS